MSLDTIRTISLELMELSLSYKGVTIFKQYEKTKEMINLIKKLQLFATPTLHPAGNDVIMYACQIADSAMLGRKIDHASALKKMHVLLGKMQDDLS